MKKLLTLFATSALAVFMVGCEVEQTEEGEMPEVDVEATEGEMPEYDMDTAEVDVESETETIKTPEVGLQEEQVQVPDVDVEMPDEGDDEGTTNE
jgi:hypothetical protein